MKATTHERIDAPIRVEGLEVAIEGSTILDRLDLEVRRGEILALVGASGSGKSVLLKTLLGLIHPRRGRVEVLGVDPTEGAEDARRDLRRRWGVAFQHGALFTSLTVAENVETPLREELDLPETLYRELALLRLRMVGLSSRDFGKRPASLSGGMRKRASIARAIAASPELLFLDEPTSGLDPVSAAALDELIDRLRHALGLTVFMVTHDLESVVELADRIAILIDGRIETTGTLEEIRRSSHPWIRECFEGPRGRSAMQARD
ncbi:MAG: ABC transporter ATP-binding protein [bacterium]